jgi:hypothetical protein
MEHDQITWKPVFEMNLESDWGFSWCIRDNNGRLIADMPDAHDSEQTAKLICRLYNAHAAKPQETEGDSYICVHAWFINDDGSQEYSDDRTKIDGWNVFTRKPCKIDGFAVLDDHDFATYEEAMAEAQRRAAITGFEIDEY